MSKRIQLEFKVVGIDEEMKDIDKAFS